MTAEDHASAVAILRLSLRSCVHKRQAQCTTDTIVSWQLWLLVDRLQTLSFALLRTASVSLLGLCRGHDSTAQVAQAHLLLSISCSLEFTTGLRPERGL